MKKETFKSAHELNERIVALQEQLEKWEKATKFEDDQTSIEIIGPEKWDTRMYADTSFIPFTMLKFMMIGYLDTELKLLQEKFEAL